MTKTWLWSDPHFGHYGITKFKDSKGFPIRPFCSSIEEHDEFLIDQCNSIVSPEDKFYILGDIAMSKRHLKTIKRLNGRKTLIAGNHDIYNTHFYLDAGFDNVRAYKHYPKNGIILSHIPVHTSQLEGRFKMNVHGHLHSNVVKRKLLGVIPIVDKRYLSVCVEQTPGYAPVDYDWILEQQQKRGLT